MQGAEFGYRAAHIRLGPEAARLTASLPRIEDRDRVFPEPVNLEAT